MRTGYGLNGGVALRSDPVAYTRTREHVKSSRLGSQRLVNDDIGESVAPMRMECLHDVLTNR
jgi:hypothetical protein